MKVKDTKLRREILQDPDAIMALTKAARRGDREVEISVGGRKVRFKRAK